jgi:serine/threonine-protein kinase RsbW
MDDGARPFAVAVDDARWQARFDAEAPAVRRARAAATDFLVEQGIDGLLLEHVRLALSEAAGNVVNHAYRDGGAGSFEVRVAVDPTAVCVIVADRGVGMRPNLGSPGCGLGLGVIAAVASTLTVRRGPDGVGATVEIGFRRARAASAVQ